MCSCNGSSASLRINTAGHTTSTRTSVQPRYADDGTRWELVSEDDGAGNRTVVIVHGKAAAFGQFYAPGSQWDAINQLT